MYLSDESGDVAMYEYTTKSAVCEVVQQRRDSSLYYVVDSATPC